MGMDVTSAQCVNYNPNRGRTLILYRAWTFFTIISALLLCSTFGAILSAYSYEIIIQQYTFTFVILSVSLVVATAVLILGCIEYHDPWTNGIFEKNKFGTEASYYDYEKFRDGYNIMRKARVGIFVEIIFSVFLYWLPQCITRIPSYAKYSVIYDSIFALCVLLNGFALAQCSFQTSWIGTSRRTPSIGIALANVILYFAVVLDLVCSGLNQIILHPFLDITGDSLREGINNIFNSIPDGVKTGVIVATGVALLKDFISQMFANINNQHPANLTQQRRHIRHRLLTHWNYTGRVSTFSRENFRAEFLTTNGLIVFFFVFIVISHNAWDTVPRPDIPEDGIVSVAIYALIFMIFSFASLWSIRDETLIQSEHMYLSVKSIKLDENSIRKYGDGRATPAWMDFCQVLCNLTANVSGIDSEDADYQNVAPMIIATAKMITTTKYEDCNSDEYKRAACKQALFFCDILRAKGNIQAIILRDASHEKNENDTTFYSSNAPLQIARDLRFANLMADLIGDDSLYPVDPKSNKCVQSMQKEGEEPLKPYDLTPLCFVKKLLNLFFVTDLDFGSTPDIYSCSNEEVIRLLKIDVFHFLFRYEIEYEKSQGIKTCGLSWLGCNCQVSQTPCETKPNIQNKKPREKLILTMPFIVVKCFEKRWKSTADPMLDRVFLNAIFAYYKHFFGQYYITCKNDELEDIAIATFRQLFDIQVNLSFIERAVSILDIPGGECLGVFYADNENTQNSENSHVLGEKYRLFARHFVPAKENKAGEDIGIQESMLRKRFEELTGDEFQKAGCAIRNNSCENESSWDKLYRGWRKIVYMSLMEPKK